MQIFGDLFGGVEEMMYSFNLYDKLGLDRRSVNDTLTTHLSFCGFNRL